MIHYQKQPQTKILADLFEAILGAVYLDSNLNYQQCKKLFFDMTKFIIDKIYPLKEIIPEAKIQQIMLNLNIQYSIQYIEVEDNIYEWVLWNED